MRKTDRAVVDVQGSPVTVLTQREDDFISLTDIAKHKEPGRADHVIQNWMRNRNTIEFLGVWERLNNAGFNPLGFEGIRNMDDSILGGRSIRWVRPEAVAAVGVSRVVRTPGTHARSPHACVTAQK